MIELDYSNAHRQKYIQNILSECSRMIADNIIKCIVYPEHDEYDLWIHQVVDWIFNINRLTSDLHITKQEYLDNLFISIGNEITDIRFDLGLFYYKYVCLCNYPYFNDTIELCNKLYLVYTNFAAHISQMLSEHSGMSMDEVESILREYLDKY